MSRICKTGTLLHNEEEQETCPYTLNSLDAIDFSVSIDPFSETGPYMFPPVRSDLRVAPIKVFDLIYILKALFNNHVASSNLNNERVCTLTINTNVLAVHESYSTTLHYRRGVPAISNMIPVTSAANIPKSNFIFNFINQLKIGLPTQGNNLPLSNEMYIEVINAGIKYPIALLYDLNQYIIMSMFRYMYLLLSLPEMTCPNPLNRIMFSIKDVIPLRKKTGVFGHPYLDVISDDKAFDRYSAIASMLTEFSSSAMLPRAKRILIGEHLEVSACSASIFFERYGDFIRNEGQPITLSRSIIPNEWDYRTEMSIKAFFIDHNFNAESFEQRIDMTDRHFTIIEYPSRLEYALVESLGNPYVCTHVYGAMTDRMLQQKYPTDISLFHKNFVVRMSEFLQTPLQLILRKDPRP